MTRTAAAAPPRRTAVRARHRVRRATAVIIALLVAAAMACGFAPVRSEADAPTYTITVTPATALADGQAFTVRVTGMPGMTINNSGFCDPDMPPATSQADLTEWCTENVGSGKPGGSAPADPNGVAEITVQAGVGAASKVSAALGTSHSWNCDASSPCLLPLVISPPGGQATFDTSTVLTYREDDPTAGCGGPAGDQFGTAAPDRMTEQWVAWTVGDCAGKGLPTRSSFTEDGSSLAQFNGGSVDLAYAGVAPGTPGFGDADRKAVATPVALNATVLAVAGYYPGQSSVPGVPLWKHIDSVKMTYPEAAALLSGNLELDEDLQDSLIARNPELQIQANAVGFTSPSTLAGPQATTEYVSTALAAKDPKGWAYPNSTSKFSDHAGKPLGTFADYNTIYDSLGMINLSAGKPQLVGSVYKQLSTKPEAVSLVSFYLTDLATARQLGLAPVALGDATNGFVLPTPASLAAAVPAMGTLPDGVRTPPVKAPQGAYPLTYVEYAFTPSEQLLDSSCKPKTTELTAIKHWLTYIDTSGQAPALFTDSGMVPLTSDLIASAKASLAKIWVGTPTSGSCAKPAPRTTPGSTVPTTVAPTPTDDGGDPSAGDPSAGSSLDSSDLSTAGDDSAAGATRFDDSSTSGGATTTAVKDTGQRSSTHSIIGAQRAAARTTIPRLPGAAGSPILLGVLGFPLLVALTSGTTWLSTGQPFPAALARLRRRRRGRR